MSPQGSKGRVLIADDNVALLETCAEVLEDAGFDVQTAVDGREALNCLGQADFEAVVSDIQMPGLDGLQLLRAVRARDLDVPVLMMTGNPNVETAVQALNYGALGYLVKPTSADALIQAVEQAVRLNRIARVKRQALTHLGMHDKLLGDRAGLEAGFNRALQSLWMAYQPIVRAADAAVFGHEALVRTHEHSVPHPGALFDAAERLGRVPELSRRIRDRVAETLQTAASPGILFVNLHPFDLSDEALLANGSRLSTHAETVVLEVTERAPLDSMPGVRERIQSLRDLGYRIAIDDLGAGYAGLTSFATLEPDIVKLDMALVRGVDREPVKRKLVASMTSLCKELGILVVAEGMETPLEREALTDMGCDLLQGFLFGRPAGLSAMNPTFSS